MFRVFWAKGLGYRVHEGQKNHFWAAVQAFNLSYHIISWVLST